jgi:3-hydroxybutyryl-CoA dehydrogenase
MSIKTVGIIGCGAMGTGIAQVMLQGGCHVVVCEASQDLLDKGIGRLNASFNMLVEKEKITAARRDELMSRLKSTTELKDMFDIDLVIEAVFEDLQVKSEIFKKLDAVCNRQTVFASNTSSMSITELASATSRPDRFVGLHFFNPAPLMPLVEAVKTILTDQAVMDEVVEFIRLMGKTPVIAKDEAGFIVNALTTPFLLDAMRSVANGSASVEDIDIALKLGMNHPMGPLMLSDLIGLDVLYKGSSNMYAESQDRRYAPPGILKKMVLMNLLGKKTKKGFYDWSDPRNPMPSNLTL